MPKIVESPECVAVAKSISLEKWEWEEIDKLAAQWRTSRGGAIRRIWMEWDSRQAEIVSIPIVGTIGG